MKAFITKEGKQKLHKEITERKKARKEIIKSLQYARSLGDFSENAEYHAEKENQGMNEARLSVLEDLFSRSHEVDPGEIKSVNKVVFGLEVTLEHIETQTIIAYQLVSQYESDAGNGKISIESQLGEQLIGKTIGDYVTVVNPVTKEEKTYRIAHTKRP